MHCIHKNKLFFVHHCRMSFILCHILDTFKSAPLCIKSVLGDNRLPLCYMLPMTKGCNQNKKDTLEQWSWRPTHVNISVPQGKARTPSDQLLAVPCSLGHSHKLLLTPDKHVYIVHVFHKDPKQYHTFLFVFWNEEKDFTGDLAWWEINVVFHGKLKKHF